MIYPEENLDGRRINGTLELTCSDCGARLEFVSNACRLTSHSAYNLAVQLSIKPCAKCVGDAKKPLMLLRQALNAVEGKME